MIDARFFRFLQGARVGSAFVVFATFAALVPVARADTVTLSTGETLQGEILKSTDERVLLSHPVLGEIAIPTASVEAQTVDLDADDAAAEAGEAQAAAEQAAADATDQAAEQTATEPAEAEAPEAADEGLLPGWDSQISLGFSGKQGNSETLNFNAGFNTERETERERTAIDVSYFIETDGGDTTKNEGTAGVKHDWFFPDSRWFVFGEGRYDYDEFESYDHRVQGFVGPGYHLIAEEDLTVDLRGGLGASKEFGSQNDGVVPEGMLGADAAWQISDSQSLEATTRFFPNLEDTGDFRTRSTLDWVIKMDQADGLSLKLGLVHEYLSIVDPGDDRNDLKYYGALVFDF